ncbi:MAG: BlaI/MecI/CopY family transcriptional regulator [Acidobacteriota bacterium]
MTEELSRDRRLDGLPDLAASELDVLSVLWADGRRSAREVHEALADTHDWAYSTTRTVLDRMVKKGLVDKVSFHRMWLFEPAISRPRGLARRVRDFADKVLGLDAAAVVPLFARGNALTAEEIDELSRLLETEETAR